MSTVAERVACVLCGVVGRHRPYQERALCVRCSLLGCPACWRATVRAEWGRFRLRNRMVCPACGWKGRWR